ncbi:MAG TPA: hypothetical protein DCW44_02260 [Eubacterium sp.]|nr:hypothetical protein [Eubacterium sp.]
MMNYNEFKEYMREHILEHLPEEYRNGTVKIEKVYKNNDVILDSIRITGVGEGNMFPLIYLNDSYAIYESGKSIDEIAEKLANFYMENLKPQFDINGKKLTSFEDAKENIACRVCNVTTNKERLAGMPYTVIADDIAVTYSVIVNKDKDGFASAPIRNDLMMAMGVDIETLHDVAVKNIEKIYQPTLKSMDEVIRGLMAKEFMEVSPIEFELNETEEMFDEIVGRNPMYVLSSANGVNGAACIASPKVMDMVSEKLGGDFYMIPSSTHEVILIPKSVLISPEELSDMVVSVNESCVEPQDILSNHVYEYDIKTRMLHSSVVKNQEIGDKDLSKDIGKEILENDKKLKERDNKKGQYAKTL